MNLIWLEDLEVRYGRQTVLSLDQVKLPTGIAGLLGANGAGKSTLIRVLLGLIKPRRGTGQLLDMDIRRHGRRIRERVGYMPEDHGLIAGLSGLQLVTLAGELCGMPRRQAIRRAHETLSYVSLRDERNRDIETYSTGMKQRVKLAQALVHDPAVLILDEPTDGLDPTGRREMLDLVKALYKDYGKSVLLSTHIMSDVESLCQSVLVLDGGRVAAQGTVDELATLQDESQFDLQVEGETDQFVAMLESRGAQVVNLRRQEDRCEMTVLTPGTWNCRPFFEIIAALQDQSEQDATRYRVVAGKQAVAPVLRSVRPVTASLDAYFKQMAQPSN